MKTRAAKPVKVDAERLDLVRAAFLTNLEARLASRMGAGGEASFADSAFVARYGVGLNKRSDLQIMNWALRIWYNLQGLPAFRIEDDLRNWRW